MSKNPSHYHFVNRLLARAILLGLLIWLSPNGKSQISFPTAFTANTVFVDGKYGNDVTAQRERSDFPFQSITAAYNAASNGDRIVVRPGAYNSSGSITIAKSNLTVDAYGATLNATSGSDAVKLIIAAPDVALRGLEVNGHWTNEQDQNTGLITVSSPATRFTIEDCYVHDGASTGLRFADGDWSGSSVRRCRFANVVVGVTGANYGLFSAIRGLEVSNSRFEECRRTGIYLGNEPNGNSNGNLNSPNYYIKAPRIFGNYIRNAPASHGLTGIELFFGCDGGFVSNNYVAGFDFAISVGSDINMLVANNTVHAGAYCGIEFADNPANANCVASGNWIDMHDENGSVPSTVNSTGGGYAISNNYGNTNSGLVIEGGAVYNQTDGRRGLGARNVDGITVRNVYFQGVNPLFIQYCNNVTIQDCRVDHVGIVVQGPSNGARIHRIAGTLSTTPVTIQWSDDVEVNDCSYDLINDTQGLYGIDVQAGGGQTHNHFRFSGNRFYRYLSNGDLPTNHYAYFHFYGSGTPATFNDVRIEGTRTNTGFGGSGFVDYGGNTVNVAAETNNEPSVSGPSQTQSGFLNIYPNMRLAYYNQDYVNANGDNSILFLDNPNGVGQTIEYWQIAGTRVYKHRADYLGGNYFTGGSLYSFDAPIANNGTTWFSGIGSPDGVVTAPVGSLYTRTDGGAGTTLYVKESGSGNTGWVAK